MRLYNSLTRQMEEFVPLDSERKVIKVYTCGPTVYDHVTIGNWRTYVLSDLMVRTLSFFGYSVSFVMNITDVGHLTGDNLGDSSAGEDRMEKGARRLNKTAWDVADYYARSFLAGYSELGLTLPKKFTRATDYIKEQIELVLRIEQKGFAYLIDEDGIYFDVKAYEKAGNSYGDLSNIDQVKEGARVEINPHKRDPRDFALWKLSNPQENRHMEWSSPWGMGFPGWHIECSAMIMKELGDQIDLHMGGEDLRSTHHPNEIAQSESATGKKPFVKYWIHGAFLQVDGGRMGKSLGNAYALHDLTGHDEGQRGYDVRALKYFYLGGHYRKPLNFTFQALDASDSALGKLLARVAKLSSQFSDQLPPVDTRSDYHQRFSRALSEDLNMPEALAVLWDVVGADDLEVGQKLALIKDFDRVLGLDLQADGIEEKIPQDILVLNVKRDHLRTMKLWDEADAIRTELGQKGYEIQDTPYGGVLSRKRGL